MAGAAAGWVGRRVLALALVLGLAAGSDTPVEGEDGTGAVEGGCGSSLDTGALAGGESATTAG